MTVSRPSGFEVPDEAALTKLVKSKITACGQAGMFATPPITIVKWEAKPKSAKGAGVDKGDSADTDQE